jgi:hypothetical protein
MLPWEKAYADQLAQAKHNAWVKWIDSRYTDKEAFHDFLLNYDKLILYSQEIRRAKAKD